MSIGQKQQEAFVAWKVFNNAVTTSRLYPAMSPRVANSVDKAYQAVKAYARKFGELSLSVRTDAPCLAGVPVQDEMCSEIKQMVIYRHLDLLKLEHVVLKATFDRKIFADILSIFIARKEKIDREGGGRAFVHNLGLESFFPEAYRLVDENSEPIKAKAVELRLEAAPVQPGLLGYLFGEHDRQESRSALRLLVKDPEQLSNLVRAGTARLFRELAHKQGIDRLVVSDKFTIFLKSINDLVDRGRRGVAAEAAATSLLAQLNEAMLTILLVQRYPEGFPERFSTMLVERAPSRLFDAMLTQLRYWQSDPDTLKFVDPAQLEIVNEVAQRLLTTKKGRQFLGKEKARSLIKSGEDQRKGRRLEKNLNALLEGNKEILKNEEALLGLPSELNKLLKQGQVERVERLLTFVVAEMLNGDAERRRRLIQCLVMIGSMFLDQKRWEWLEKIDETFICWVRVSDSGDSSYEKCVFLLQAVMSHGWESGNYEKGDQILPIFHKIRVGALRKTPPVRAIVGRIQDRFYNRSFFSEQLQRYLASPRDKQAAKRLSMLGRPAGAFLIEQLLEQEEAADRLKIMDILAGMGAVVVSVIMEKLPEPMPWYSKINLIKLASTHGGFELISDILPLLRHDDIRVQREAFTCIHNLGGKRRKEALLLCLSHSSEAMLSQIVRTLLPFSDGETAGHLKSILDDQEHFSDKIREPLVLETVKVMARSKSKQGKDALASFLANKKKRANRKLSDTVWLRVEAALKQLDSSTRTAAAA